MGSSTREALKGAPVGSDATIYLAHEPKTLGRAGNK